MGLLLIGITIAGIYLTIKSYKEDKDENSIYCKLDQEEMKKFQDTDRSL